MTKQHPDVAVPVTKPSANQRGAHRRTSRKQLRSVRSLHPGADPVEHCWNGDDRRRDANTSTNCTRAQDDDGRGGTSHVEDATHGA
jgi:hypothetical protein